MQPAYYRFTQQGRGAATPTHTLKRRGVAFCQRDVLARYDDGLHLATCCDENPGAPPLDHWAPLELSARRPHALATFNGETIKPLWPFALTRPSVLGSCAAAKKRQLTGQVSGDSTFDIYGRWNLHHEWNREFTSGMQHYATCLFYPNKQSSSQALLAVVCCG